MMVPRPLDEGQPLYLETRWGGNTENAGPQFQISWRAEKEAPFLSPWRETSSPLQRLYFCGALF